MAHLPPVMRPVGLNGRDFQPGIDLPCWFLDGLKSLDSHLYLVWHPYGTLYDDVMNQYTGTLEDSRFCIQDYHGREVWGWPLLDNKGQPIPDNKWHVWQLAYDYGWSHVFNIDSSDYKHLVRILDHLHLQSIKRAIGPYEWARYLDQKQQADQAKAIANQEDLHAQIDKANSGFIRKVMENFERGQVKPTNPTRDIIASYPGQTKFSKIERLITDKEGGLITPGDE